MRDEISCSVELSWKPADIVSVDRVVPVPKTYLPAEFVSYQREIRFFLNFIFPIEPRLFD